MRLHDQNAFLDAYLECALWSELDNDGNQLSDSYDASHLAEEAKREAAKDCEDFIQANASDLAESDVRQCGQDFWLSRNGHGTGFWDRGYGDRGDRLHAAAKVYGETCLYVGDDGQLYVT